MSGHPLLKINCSTVLLQYDHRDFRKVNAIKTNNSKRKKLINHWSRF